MTNNTTTYNNSGNTFLLLGEVRRVLLFLLIMLLMGVGSAWADTWDGNTKTAPDMSTYNGSSEALAIQITNAEELAWLGDQMKAGNTANGKTYGGKYWKLTADIDLGGNSDFTGKDWASMIGNTGNAFCGYFNGNNKTISNIQVAAVVSTKYYGLFPSIQGKSTTDPSSVSNLKINGVYFQATAANMAANTRVGGLAGYVKQANISNIEVSNVTFTYTNTITGTNQLGGAIGCMENNTTLDNVDVTGVTASFSNTTTGLYVGGIVGASTGNANTNSITNCDAKTIKVTHSSNITGTTYMGGLVGNANTSLNVINNNTVSGVEGKNEGKGFDVSIEGTTMNLYVGGLLGYTYGDEHEVKGNHVEKVYVTTTGTETMNRMGGLIGHAQSSGTTGYVFIKGNTATDINLTADGNTLKVGTTEGNIYAGGLIGIAQGKASPDNRTIIVGNTVTNSNITMNGEHNISTLFLGGFLGYCETHTNVLNNKVENPKLSITNNINAAAYVGGAVGAQATYTLIDGMTVDGGTITGPSTDKTIANNKALFVGGFLGQQNSSGTANYQPNKFKNIAVSGMNINLEHFVPAGQIKDHKFSVGGIAGTVSNPYQDTKDNRGMPENLIAKSIKIYAPWASVSPTVSNFNTGAAAHNNLTSEVVTTVDALERSKTASWYYNDFQLGLSTAFLNSTAVKEYNAAPAQYEFRKNYSATPTVEDGISYLAINEGTLLRQNRYCDNDRDSWTVLWWTNQGTRDDTKATPSRPAATLWTDTEQPIYPQSGATYAQLTGNLSDYPYYMYFYQGVANAKYASATDADAIIAGIAANMTQAAKTTPVTLTITNDKENERGFDERTITVEAKTTDAEGNETDVTSSYTYQWYLNGKAYATSSSINLTPHWKDGQGLTVNALSGSTIVATATYTLVPGVMKTKTGDTEKVRSGINSRGTASNPYIIDHENALRQLSFLSTSHTGTRWEGIVNPVSPFPTNQPVGHYNRAYYELGADITMTTEAFTPISHMGYSADATWGSYHQNFIFQGSFDGKGHKISGLNITWGAGQYNGGANAYHGLFGAVGNPTATAKWQDGSTSSTVIKNLIIDGAKLTHDVNNTSFYYNNGTSSNANNCMVGVLAGIVGSNTTIQNIEIRNSKITDNGSSDYSLAKLGLYVGGAIGSVQNAFGTTVSGLATSTKIDHIAAQVDITLTHPTFFTATPAVGEVGQFNVGGIVGRYIATSQSQDNVQGTLPKYTFYSGNINAPKAWISPVLAAVRYTSQTATNSWANLSKQWEGNNNAAEQLTITNAQYYKFKINGQPISDFYPANTCGNDARTIVAHTDATEAAATYDARKYQGVNYGTRFIDSDETTLYFMNQEPADNFYWAWDNGFPHMTDQPQTEAYLDRTDNTLTAQMSEGTGSAYRWQVSFDEGKSWADIDGVTLQQYIANPSSMNKLIVAYVTSGVTEYRTQVESIFACPNPFDVHIAKTGDSGTGYTFNVVWEDGTVPSGSLTPTYQWYESDQETPLVGQTSASLTLSQSELDAAGGYIWCAVKVQESGTTVYSWMLVAGDLNVVYVNGNGYTGSDSNGDYGVGDNGNDGRSPQKPVKTIDHANSLLKSEAEGGNWDKNIIVVMGMLNNNDFFRSNGKNPATLTGQWNGTDYEGIINIKKTSGEDVVNPITAGKAGLHCYVLADTKFENLTFNGADEDNAFIECHGNDVWFGKGLIMTNFRRLSKNHGNFDGAQVVPELTILLTATNLPEADIAKYTNRTKPQVITFQSGHYGRIMSGRYTNGFFAKPENTSHSILGSAEHPIWAVVNIDIDPDNPNKGVVTKNSDNKPEVTDGYTCDINAVIAGLTDGSMYGDFTINYHGGNVSYIVGGNQGNPVPNGTLDFEPDGGVSGMSLDKPVAWGQWPNATYFGRAVINVEQDPYLKTITVGSLYSGGLGRQANGSSAKSIVDMYFYGHTEVNVKSGTVDNVYGGGAGGVMGVNPWDAHLPYATTDYDDANRAIMNKVQYGDTRYGTWSNMVKGTNPFAKVTLHDLNDAGTGYDVKKLDLDSSYTTLNISGGTIKGSVYGGGYGYVADMPYQVALQGIGSVFGTSNINITGGTITGSVYGGSQGNAQFYGQKNNYGQTITHIAEMVGTVNLNITGTDDKYPTIGGNIYGAGQGIPSTASEEYLRIATAGNTDLGNDYKTDINITIDMPESIEFPNDIYGGGALGKVDGTTNIVLKRGTFTGNIYGGGYGEKQHRDKARVTGTTNIYTGGSVFTSIDRNAPVSIQPNATQTPTIYGGGNMAQVTGNTYINLWHGNINANIYGGGRGLNETQSAGYSGYGWVYGNTRVLYNNENNLLTGNIFGGGALGAVLGNTNVVVKAGEVEGNIFGGGQGEEGSEKAKVTGDTNVIVDSEWTEPTPPTP